jgi:hypothetical protein
MAEDQIDLMDERELRRELRTALRQVEDLKANAPGPKSKYKGLTREALEDSLDQANTTMGKDGVRIGNLEVALVRLLLDYEMAKFMADRSETQWFGSPMDASGDARRVLKEHSVYPEPPSPAARIAEARKAEATFTAGVAAETFDSEGLRNWLKEAGARTPDSQDPEAYRVIMGDEAVREMGFLIPSQEIAKEGTPIRVLPTPRAPASTLEQGR